MSFDWAEYLALARHLLQPGTTTVSAEAALRCAISRSYYAVFCSARNYLRDRGLYQPTYDYKDHGRVPKSMTNHGFPHLATDMNRLRQRRIAADYQDSISKPHDQARFAVEAATYVLDKLGQL